MERRSFLRNTLSATAGAFVVPTVIPAHVIGKNPAGDKINIGLIGCGRIARDHNLPEILKYDGARLTAVCDLDSKRLADGKKMIGDYYAAKKGSSGYVDIKMYEDYREMLQNPSIDAVIICTPDHWHAQPAIEAALAKKDIYLQKPATLTVAEGRLLSEVVARQGVILQMGAQCRSSVPEYRRAAELVRNGRIGKLHTVTIGLPGDPSGPEAPEMAVPKNLNYNAWLGSTPEVYYTEMRVHPQNGYSRPGWLRCEQFGAGMITGWGAHFFDYSSWGMDTELTGPVSVEGVARFPRSGLWDVHGDFMLKSEYQNGITMYTSGGFPSGIKYEGEEGWIFVTHAGGNILKASDPKILDSVIKENEIHLYRSDEQHGNWLDCIRSRKEPISPAEMGHRACSVGLISQIAMKVPGVLKWDPKTERFKDNDLANSMLIRKQRHPYGTDYIKGI
ncbi:MAG TPA: Gfo/Idh/MocA family oxidoreductase [Prolixibacteraceae bacterium]|nr:Gfo/Idh/MocA family oxidoreductase [Prolixibacteraceae bacterium]